MVGPFQVVVINMLEALPKTSNESQFVVEITDRYSEFNKSPFDVNNRSYTNCHHLLVDLVMLHVIQSYLSVNTRPKFVRKIFTTFHSLIGLKNGGRLTIIPKRADKQITTAARE